MDQDEVRAAVRSNYAKIAQSGAGCGCSGASAGCCGAPNPAETSVSLGYAAAELEALPEGADMGLGCGNPQAIAALRPGETVLDLGSGGGLDVFLAARQVGDAGFAIGVDMTPDMVEKARSNARKAAIANVEFRLGEIERLPVADTSVDVVMSNCVINLSPDKLAVFREAFRVLRPGGRIAISDVVSTALMPPELAADVALLTGCMAGAAAGADIEGWLAEVGFAQIRVVVNEESRSFIKKWAPDKGMENYVASAMINAVKP